MISKFRMWFIKLLVGKEALIMNCNVNGKGIKKGWSFAGPTMKDCVASPRYK